MLERALALSDGERVTADDLQFSSVISEGGQSEKAGRAKSEAGASRLHEAYGDMEGYMEDIEKEIISAALEESRWNKTATAKLLGISFRSLRYRLKKLNLED